MKRTFRPKRPRRTLDDAPLPVACDVHDLARIFDVSEKTVYGWHYAGDLRRFQLARPIGTKRWSGRLLQAYLDGEGNPLVELRRRA